MKNIIIRHHHIGNKWIISFLGIPVYIKKYDDAHAYYSLFGIRFLKRNRNIKFGVSIPNTKHVSTSPDKLYIAIAEGGGMGDDIIQITYIKEIRKLFNKPVVIDFFCRSYKTFQNFPFIDNCLPYPDKLPIDKYDVFIVSRRFYIVLKNNEEKTKLWSPEFNNFLVDCKNLTDVVLGGEYHDNLFTQYALLHGKNRLEQSNTHNMLPLDRNTPKYMRWEEIDFDVLQKYNLTKEKYITISRAADSKYGEQHPKLWLLEYYNELVQKLKCKYPNIKLIQIGADSKFSAISGIDLDLRGKTTIGETKVLLKYAALHIDSEGGLVHLRNTLNGKSVVMFGPTNPDVFGYAENLNLRSKACPYPCEWITRNWTEQCLLGKKTPLCMKTLTPNYVFREICNKCSFDNDYKLSVSKALNIKKLKQTDKVALCLDSDDKLSEFDFGNLFRETLSEKGGCDCELLNKFCNTKIIPEFAYRYNVPAQDNTFNYVFCDWLDKAAKPKFIVMEMMRIVKSGGTVCFYTDTDMSKTFKEFGLKIKKRDNKIYIKKGAK